VHGLRPEFIGEDDRAGGVGAVVGGTEEAAEDGAQAHDFEVVPSTTPAGISRGWPRPMEVKSISEKVPSSVMVLQVLAEVVDFRDGEGGVVDVNAGALWRM
jgi:hypothetical protein